MRTKNPFRSLHPSSQSKGSSGASTPDPNDAGCLKLSQVLRINPLDKTKIEPSFIAVPGYCTPPVHEWDMPNELSRAARDLESISHMHLYTYQPNYVPPDEFSWETFLQAGRDLEQDLARLAEKYPQRPIIFIAHSLGGVLLKKALLLAHQNVKDPRFQILIECLSGILFLGTPHCNGDTSDPDTLLHHNLILHRCAKVSVQTQGSRLPQEDMAQLAGLSAKFTEIASMPILSVFERENQQIQQRHTIHRLFSSKKPALVDEKVATISGTDVRTLGTYLTHVELCKMSQLNDEHSSFSASSFLHALLKDIAIRHLADNEQSRQAAPRAGRHVRQTSNYLNPLSLASPHLRRQEVDNSAAGRNNKMQDQLDKVTSDLRKLSTKHGQLLGDKKAQLPCFMLAQHPPNPDFVGRSDIFTLMDKQLLPGPESSQQSPGQASVRLFALYGMGGLGKTDTSIEYAHSRRDKFDAVFWLDAGSISQLATDFGKIPSQLGLESVEESQNLETSIELAKAWLADPRNGRGEDDMEYRNCSWLLIFDNADQLPDIAEYIPHSGNGSVLITSRDPEARTHFSPHGKGCDLKHLATEEASVLLYRLVYGADASTDTTSSEDEAGAALELARELRGLPLAMTQAAGHIRRRHLSLREFVNQWKTKADATYLKFHETTTASQQYRYRYTLATAYNFHELTSGAHRLLRLLAFLNPDHVQESIFVGSSNSVDGGIDRPFRAGTFEDARSELLSLSIVKRNILKQEISIHRLIQSEIRTGLKDTEMYSLFRDSVRMLAAVWPRGNLSTQASNRWPQCERLLPHLEHFYKLYTEYAYKWNSYEVETSLPELMNEAAVYLHERGLSHEGKPYLHLALDLCERGNLRDEPLLSDMHLTMGALSNETNDAPACFYHNTLCLDLRMAQAKKNGEADVRLAFSHSQMGIAFMMIKKFAQATEHFKKCVEILHELKPDEDEYGFPSCNLGLAYWFQGQLDDADRTLTALLAQRERLHGKLDTVSYKTGRVLQALGNVKMSKANAAERKGELDAAKVLWDEAFQIHTCCLQQYESTLGKLNHRTAEACHKLAEHHIRKGEDTIAQSYLGRALSIWGERHWFKNERARSSFLRGTHLQAMGGKENVEEGKKWVELAILLRIGILSKTNPQKLEQGNAAPAAKQRKLEKAKELEQADFDELVCFWSI